MHQPIRDNLEEYLKGAGRKVPQEFQEHVEACGDCAGELRMFQAQTELLRLLRAEPDMEPRVGFYARVMDRIEQDGRASMWSVLLQPRFGRRLAMASAALVVLLGTYFVTSESTEPLDTTTAQVAVTNTSSASDQDSLQQQRQRDAVLVNLAAYHE